MRGLFLVVEGPNGVGKSTTARLLGELISQHGPVHLTTETTHTPFGEMVRSQEKWLAGRALALAVAADRYAHVEREILPKLEVGVHVISDRYVPSSLVLQRIDGLTLDEVWDYNRHALVPDMVVYLDEDPETIRARLAERATLSRLEKDGSPELERELYRDAEGFLTVRGWHQLRVDCRGLTPEAVAEDIANRIRL